MCLPVHFLFKLLLVYNHEFWSIWTQQYKTPQSHRFRSLSFTQHINPTDEAKPDRSHGCGTCWLQNHIVRKSLPILYFISISITVKPIYQDTPYNQVCLLGYPLDSNVYQDMYYSQTNQSGQSSLPNLSIRTPFSQIVIRIHIAIKPVYQDTHYSQLIKCVCQDIPYSNIYQYIHYIQTCLSGHPLQSNLSKQNTY